MKRRREINPSETKARNKKEVGASEPGKSSLSEKPFRVSSRHTLYFSYLLTLLYKIRCLKKRLEPAGREKMGNLGNCPRLVLARHTIYFFLLIFLACLPLNAYLLDCLLDCLLA